MNLRNGFNISTTPEHKYLVFERMRFVEKEARKLKPGDRIVCVRKLDQNPDGNIKERFLDGLKKEPFYLNLNKKMSSKIEKKIRRYGIEKLRTEIKSKIGYKGFLECISKGRYRLEDILRIIEILNISVMDIYDNTKWIFYRKEEKTK